MSMIYHGVGGTLHFQEPEIYINNEARHRSGHMTHAMLELSPGNLLDFNSNCSAERMHGHTPFGWVESRRSSDYGKTWTSPVVFDYSMKTILDGIWTISLEKAVYVKGIITAFLLRNSQLEPCSCEPWGTPLFTRSMDGGVTWTEPVEFSPCPGRIYDAVMWEGSIFVLMHCHKNFYGKTPDHLYRLYRSDDAGATFHEVSVVDINTDDHSYGALQFRPDGSLLAYLCNIPNPRQIAVSISYDQGKTWKNLGETAAPLGIRNIQTALVNGCYIMHGRGALNDEARGFIFYTSKDGITWDNGYVLEGTEDRTCCYYSNNLLLKPDGKEKLLVQYSETFGSEWRVNVKHLFLTVE